MFHVSLSLDAMLWLCVEHGNAWLCRDIRGALCHILMYIIKRQDAMGISLVDDYTNKTWFISIW